MSFYAGLSKKGNSVLSFLLKGVAKARSGISVLKALRDVDKGYRKEIFDKDYSIVAGAGKLFKGMRYIGKSRTIGKDWYTKAGSPLSSTGVISTPVYQTVIELRGIHTETGEKITRHVTVSHDVVKLRRELEDDAIIAASETSPKIKWIQQLPVLARKTAEIWG